MFTSSPSVTCQRYEPRKRPGPLAVSQYRDAAFPVEGSGRPLRSRSILLRCPAGRGYHSVHLRSGLQPFCLRFAVADTTQDSIRSCLAQALPRSPSQATELNALARRNPHRTVRETLVSYGSSRPGQNILPDVRSRWFFPVSVDRRHPTGRPFAPAPLQSLPHYYERLRPCAPPWYSCRGCLLDRLPSHRSDRFSRSAWKPGSRSRHLHAGRRHHRAPPN